MKTLKVFAIAVLTFGAVSAANAQVGISIQANFGRTAPYLPIYTEPVYVERPVVYHRPEVVYVERPVVYHRRPVVYHNRTVVVDKSVRYRDDYRHNRKFIKYKKHGHGKHWKHARYRD
ncbi:hypothetical protein DJ568_14745 [Mucilaginibacter hurinus]|uniref:Virulence factor n=1 Tax=Mucilaginibacter hurinus TaxID=2201324 RepID=A0A367GM71_9SPHI|nr:hypothetical protein [Mucilaginibacter hurinus]RCH54135.1 hypothetical protein DJ568_14745 [Mucilaginibacter hurinus]